MITIDLTDVAKLIAANTVAELVADQLEDIATGIFVDLTAPPPLGTPVDTGAARLSWELDLSDPLAPEVKTSLPYMPPLNDGHSQQSPAGFIEAATDKNLP